MGTFYVVFFHVKKKKDTWIGKPAYIDGQVYVEVWKMPVCGDRGQLSHGHMELRMEVVAGLPAERHRETSGSFKYFMSSSSGYVIV